MNKRGMSGGMKVILWILAAIIFFMVVTGSLNLAWFKSVWPAIQKTTEFTTAELEEMARIHNETKAKREEIHKEASGIRQALLDASNFISGKNNNLTYASITNKGTNKDKIKNLDEAIKKYLEHYKECEERQKQMLSVSGCLPPEGIKFRILNALREKFFILIVVDKNSQKANNEYNAFDPSEYNNLISIEEFKSTILLVNAVAYTNLNKFVVADTARVIYTDKYYMGKYYDDFNSAYYEVSFWYLMMKQNPPELPAEIEDCSSKALPEINLVFSMTNKKLTFEQRYKILGAEDYQFIKVPYNWIKQGCVS